LAKVWPKIRRKVTSLFTCGGIWSPKESSKQQVLSPNNAVDRFVGRIAKSADGVALGHRLCAALKAFSDALQVDSHLHRAVGFRV
jgi:hypothetical protein